MSRYSLTQEQRATFLRQFGVGDFSEFKLDAWKQDYVVFVTFMITQTRSWPVLLIGLRLDHAMIGERGWTFRLFRRGLVGGAGRWS